MNKTIAWYIRPLLDKSSPRRYNFWKRCKLVISKWLDFSPNPNLKLADLKGGDNYKDLNVQSGSPGGKGGLVLFDEDEEAGRRR